MAVESRSIIACVRVTPLPEPINGIPEGSCNTEERAAWLQNQLENWFVGQYGI
jgi:hypothetical protein